MREVNDIEYTKGPWYVEDADAAVPICAESDGMLIAYVDYTKVRRNPIEYAANAALIAASPELLEALKALRSFMWAEGYADQNIPMAQADAAIEKAEAVNEPIES